MNEDVEWGWRTHFNQLALAANLGGGAQLKGQAMTGRTRMGGVEVTVERGAGSASGIDLCLHVVRRDHGAAVANEVARRMVVPPHREGGQA